MAPPPPALALAVSLVKVEPVTERVPGAPSMSKKSMAPPSLVSDELLVKVQLVMVRLPWAYSMAPPGVFVWEPERVLLVNAQLCSVVLSPVRPATEPPSRPAPPSPCWLVLTAPFRMVAPLRLKVTLPTTLKSTLKMPQRKIAVSTQPGPCWMVVLPAPAPTIATLSPEAAPTWRLPKLELSE